ncbi:unnamed protein product [Closterium sp. Naga37s-1]|nr:unnamed protein product [Closterium sp. Naga37s-1]
MPVALGADSPLPYSSRPFGVASVVLAPPVLSTPVELEAGMSTAGSPAPVSCSTVVGSAQATSGVGGSTPVPASFLAPAVVVAPPPVPVVAPSHVPPPGVLHSPVAEQVDAAMMASASGEAPPPAPVQVPSPVAAVAVSEARAAVSPGGLGESGQLAACGSVTNSSPSRSSPGGCTAGGGVSSGTLGPGYWCTDLLLVQTLAHGSLSPVPAESLLDGLRDDCLDAVDQIALLLEHVLAAPVRGGVGAVGQLDVAVRRRYLWAGSRADAIVATILVVHSVWQTMTGILNALQADRM